MEELNLSSKQGREVAKIMPDGSWSIVPDITMDEIQTVFHPLLETAAKLLKRVAECKARHQS